jgi:hypothetical protein
MKRSILAMLRARFDHSILSLPRKAQERRRWCGAALVNNVLENTGYQLIGYDFSSVGYWARNQSRQPPCRAYTLVKP